MRKLLAVLLVLLLTTPASADLLRIRMTAPTRANSGDCVTPRLLSPLSDSLFTYIELTNDSTHLVARRDSVWRRPGGEIDLSYNLSPAFYRIRVWGGRKRVDGFMVYGCDTTITKPTTPTLPWKPAIIGD